MQLAGPFDHVFTRQFFSVVCLFMGMLATAIGVIYTKHQSRILYAELQTMQQQRDTLQAEWTQLLLERGTWLSDLRVEQVASKELSMHTPKHIKVIKAP